MADRKDSPLTSIFQSTAPKFERGLTVLQENLEPPKIAEATFEANFNETLEKIENNYPNTTRSLFYLAWQVQRGFFGEQIQAKFLLNPDVYFDWDHLLLLFLYSLSRTGMKLLSSNSSCPEIFKEAKQDPRWWNLIEGIKLLPLHEIESLNQQDTPLDPNTALIKEEIHSLHSLLKNDPETLKGFSLLFRHFFDHLTNPSHRLTELLLQMKLYNKAVSSLDEIKNPVERSKSLLLLSKKWIEKNQFAKVFELWHNILDKDDRLKISQQLLEKMIQTGYQDQFLNFLNKIQDLSERNQNYQKSTLLLTQNHQYPLAIQLTNMITEQDTKDLTLSNMTNILAQQQQYPQAKKLALSIKDRGFREDAILSIVKAYLYTHHADEAIQFVNSIPNPKEKEKPSKIIELSLKSHHQNEKVKSIRDGALPQTPAKGSPFANPQ